MVTTLRKLTLKSTLKFGKYTDYTVQQVIDIGKKSYLAWVYYNMDRITFTEEILKDVLMLDHFINKPGKDEAYHYEHSQELNFVYISEMDEKNRMLKAKNTRKEVAGKYILSEIKMGFLGRANYIRKYNHSA